MKYQVINQSGNEKRTSRVKKELLDFSQKIDSIKSRSKQLLAGLHDFVDKKKIASITNQITDQPNHEWTKFW